MSPVALVTGASRGIGAEVARQLGGRGHHVLVGARTLAHGEEVAAMITAAGGTATAVELDIADEASVAAAARRIAEEVGALDVLVNNAAITYDTWQSSLDADFEVVREALDTNLFGTWRVTQALVGLLRGAGASARIVNVSSGAGALTDMGGHTPAYRISKVALNALTRMWAAELPDARVNSVCPGWVATDMGGTGGRPVAAGAAGIVWAATLGPDGPTGGFFRDERPIDW
jgi:NAD(P)-dependent dehydrogenase (short-subunit alcohol dehydrogenase family)